MALYKGGVMTESEFWSALEVRLTREFAGTQEGLDKGIWCDGFIPEEYHLAVMEPKITGRVWICLGSHQDEWRFEMCVKGQARLASEIDWALQLPSDNVTGWLTYDDSRQEIRIDARQARA